MRRMRRAIRTLLAALVLLAPAVSGCSQPSNPDASLFAGPVTIPGRTVSPTVAEYLSIQRALRRIDPCGFIDLATVASLVPSTVGYYESTLPDGCEYSGSRIRIELDQIADTPGDGDYNVNGVAVDARSVGPECFYFVHLGLAELPGAPTSPAAIRLLDSMELLVSSDGDGSCDQLEQVANTVALTRSHGMPTRHGAGTNPLAALDPCLLLTALPATTGLSVPVSQNNTMNPHGCGFTRPDAAVSLVLTNGPFWGNNEQPAPGSPIDMDGYTVNVSIDCEITVQTGPPIQNVLAHPGRTGHFAPDRPAILVVGTSCPDNKRIAAAAAKMFAPK